jgi:hypothetical protein
MKNIINFNAPKYEADSKYSLVEDGIYEVSNPPTKVYDPSDEEYQDGLRYEYRDGDATFSSSRLEPPYFVTSLSFEQEPEFQEGESPKNISQYHLEDVLDKFLVSVSDFYADLNQQSEKTCFLEFRGDLKYVKELREIIGKHVYNKPDTDDPRYVVLAIE